VIARKTYPYRRSKSRRRRWKLHSLPKEVEEGSRRMDVEAQEYGSHTQT
jgi:hypothetical protein